MPPKLDNRPDAAELLEEVRQPGANLCAIARRLGVHRNTVRAFRDKHLPKSVRDADARLSRLPRPDLQVSQLERLDALSHKLEKMIDAADRWLADPNEPGAYTLDPRDHETEVVWEEEVEGERGRMKTIRHKERLSDILRRCGEKGRPRMDEVLVVETMAGNNRRAFIDAVNAMRPLAELLGKARSEIKPDPGSTVNVLVTSPDWLALRERLADALEPYPDALAAVQEAIGGE